MRTRRRSIVPRLPAVLAVAALLALALGACGGDDDGVDDGDQGGPVRACSAERPDSSDWAGAGDSDPDTGEVDVDEFNRFLADAEPPISTSPCDAASVFAHLDQEEQMGEGEGTTVDLTVDPEGSAEATVTITRGNLPDDSLAAQRWTLEFEPADGDTIRLTRAIVSYRCQPGRGQQDFGTELCL